MTACYSGYVPEVETQMELSTESAQTQTEEESLAVDDAFEKEPSILDEILTFESSESTLRSEGDANIGRQQKEVMVSQVQFFSQCCNLNHPD